MTGIFVVALLFVAIVSGFAGLYIGAAVFPSSKTPLDALHINFFIMGFTDYSPPLGYGQLVVIAELVSGVLLLAALNPTVLPGDRGLLGDYKAGFWYDNSPSLTSTPAGSTVETGASMVCSTKFSLGSGNQLATAVSESPAHSWHRLTNPSARCLIFLRAP